MYHHRKLITHDSWLMTLGSLALGSWLLALGSWLTNRKRLFYRICRPGGTSLPYIFITVHKPFWVRKRLFYPNFGAGQHKAAPTFSSPFISLFLAWPYSITITTSPCFTSVPSSTRISLITPLRGDCTSVYTFIAPTKNMVCPTLTCCPTSTNRGSPGLGRA